MTKKIIAIVFIFFVTSIAWAILGGTILTRTYSSEYVSSSRVESTWGTKHDQSPPTVFFKTQVQKNEETTENGKKVMKTVTEDVYTTLPLESSKVDVNLNLEHRQKGLLWYSTYKVDFAGNYTFLNPSDKEQSVEFDLEFPTTQAIYDNLTFTIDGKPAALTTQEKLATTVVKIAG